MSNETQNVPDTIREEAKQRALKIISENPGCISYVRPEDLETASLFIPVITVIKPVKEEFHDYIPDIGIMPKVPLMQRIREGAGVNIHDTDVAKQSEYIWIAHSSGDQRMPDGTMEPADAVYEFDAEKRAELDFINDKKNRYTTDIAKRKHVLELCKFGASKAETGAQLRLICKLAKIQRSFKTEADLMRGMILSRVDRNVNGIMADPGMRSAIIQHALGATEDVFGPKQITAASEVDEPAEEQKPAAAPQRKLDYESGEVPPEPEQQEGQADLFHDDIPFPETNAEKIKRIREQIVDLLKDPGISEKNRDDGLKWLATKGADDLDKLVEKQTLIEGAIKNYRLRAEQLKKGRKAS
jgi:hypothetical protein